MTVNLGLVGVAPAHRRLKDGVKRRQGGIASHQKASPDQWADLAEHNTELIQAGHDPLLIIGLYPQRTPMLSLGLAEPDPPVFSALL